MPERLWNYIMKNLTLIGGFVKGALEPMTTLELPVLYIAEGPGSGQQRILDKNELFIGRGSHCDIVIPDRRVSREHVRIYRDGEAIYAEDLESRNGTYVNSEKLEGAIQLNEGDVLKIALCATIQYIGNDATVPIDASELKPTVPGALEIDRGTREVRVSGQVLDPQLSLYQYRLLELLYDNAPSICTREDVVRSVWPDASSEGITEQAIDALVRRLRDRLGEITPGDHQFIVTVRGHGFRLDQFEG
jgi:DNA-binding winged helix-turn-helix (wHTH) protein